MADASALGPRVVGRERELASIENALRGAALGVAHVALVTGEPGIGKTALLGAVATIAQDAGAIVLRASGDEFERDVNFGIVDQLVRGIGEHVATNGADRFDVGEELIARWQAEDAPLVVVLIDDAQWADAPSLQALTFALRRVSDARVVALFACRADSVGELPPGLVRLAQGESGSTTDLHGLEREAFAELLRVAGVGRMTPAQLERIREHTGGNPMHALTLVRELSHDELVSDVSGPLQAPKSIAALVLARVAALSPEAESLVVAAAVLGASCPLSGAARLAGVDDPSSALAEAEEADILAADVAAGGTVVHFTHATTRSAVYHDVGADRIAALHRRAADLETDAHDVLRHRLLGASAPDEALAMKADLTAEALARAGAWIEGSTWLVAAARVSSTTPGRTRRHLTAELYRLYAGARPRLVPGTDRDAAADHPLRPLLLGAAAVHDGRFTEAEAFIRTAWDMVDPAGDHETASRIALRMADALQGQLRPAEALDWAARALQLLPDGYNLLGEDPLSNLAYLLVLNGRLEEARHLVSGVRESVGVGNVTPGLFGRGVVRVCTDDVVGAIDDLRACAQTYMRVGPPRVCVEAIRLLAEATFRLGEWDVALQRAQDATGLARELGVGQVTIRALATGAHVRAACGQFRVAEGLVAEANGLLGVESSYHSVASISIAAARVELARGRFQEAADALERIATVVDEVPHVDQQVLIPWRLPYGLALTAVGRLDEAMDQAERLARYAAGHRIASIAAGAAHLRAVISAARGDIDAAAQDFEDAAQVYTGIPMPFEAALVRMGYGTALRRLGRRRAAAEQLDAARTVLARLGAVPFLERCDTELAGLDLGVGTVASMLSPAEAAVAGLVAEGLSNREVAAQLVLSVRTVEHHLRSIYSKLGLSSRTQLVALLKSK